MELRIPFEKLSKKRLLNGRQMEGVGGNDVSGGNLPVRILARICMAIFHGYLGKFGIILFVELSATVHQRSWP